MTILIAHLKTSFWMTLFVSVPFLVYAVGIILVRIGWFILIEGDTWDTLEFDFDRLINAYVLLVATFVAAGNLMLLISMSVKAVRNKVPMAQQYADYAQEVREVREERKARRAKTKRQ